MNLLWFVSASYFIKVLIFFTMWPQLRLEHSLNFDINTLQKHKNYFQWQSQSDFQKISADLKWCFPTVSGRAYNWAEIPMPNNPPVTWGG